MTGDRVLGSVLLCAGAGVIVLALTASSAAEAEAQAAAERKAQIEACIAHGGIPVPIAGVVASQGIGCAQPIGH